MKPPLPTSPEDPKKQLARITAELERAAFTRGFEAGVHVMKKFGDKPSGTHSLACGGSLVWDGDPISCGCRACKCVKCGQVLVSPSTPCEFAGLDCRPLSASEMLKSATLAS